MHDGRIYAVKIVCGPEYPDRVSGPPRHCPGACHARILPNFGDCVPELTTAGACVQPPRVRFYTRVNLACVQSDGQVSAGPTLHQGLFVSGWVGRLTEMPAVAGRLACALFGCTLQYAASPACQPLKARNLERWPFPLNDRQFLLQIDQSKFGILGNWNRSYSMETILSELRREMGSVQNRKLSQPPENSTY